MQEVHVELTDRGALVANNKLLVVGELADDGGFDVFRVEQGQELVHVPGRGGQHHSLLCLGDPDLVIPQPLILQRDLFQIDDRAKLGAHLSHRAGQAPRPAVCNGRVQAPVGVVPRPQQRVQELLLGDGVADLHRVGELVCVRGCQLSRRERRPVNPVATRPAAHQHDQVTRLGFLEGKLPGDQSHATAKDKRVAEVSRVETDRAVDGRDAHAVAVVAHPRDHALEHRPRM